MGKGQASEPAVAERVAGEQGGATKRRKLVGCKNFVRCNPRSDKFEVRRFHHVEVWCGDATNAARRYESTPTPPPPPSPPPLSPVSIFAGARGAARVAARLS